MTKSLGFWRTWSLVVGTMIGSGIFTLPTVLAPYGSNSLLGWIAAGAGTLFIAVMLGALARRIPRIGGPYAYTRAAFGDLPAFLIAWGYWIGVWSAVAAVAVSFTGYLNVFIPSLAARPFAGAVASIAAIWLFTGVNVAGVRSAGAVQFITTLLKLVPLFVIAVAGFAVGDVTTVPSGNPGNQSFPLMMTGLVMLTMWAYIGVEAATIPADDVVDPQRTIPRALTTGTLTVTLVYIAATLGVMALIPTTDLAQSTSPFADAAARIFGNWGTKFVGIGVLVSLIGALNANILLTGQVLRATALDGMFPARLAVLNKNDAPATALAVSSLFATVLIMLNYTKGLIAAFELMILLSTLATLVPYTASALADLVLQKREATDGAALNWKSIFIAIGALSFSLFAIIGSGLEVIGYGLFLMLAGLPVYFWMTHKRG